LAERAPEADHSTLGGMAAEQPTLEALDRRKIAVQMVVLGREHLLTGHGVYERRGDGHCLRIELPASAGFELVLLEGSWLGTILSGDDYDCDYLIRIA
jgi:hypothetical protein